MAKVFVNAAIREFLDTRDTLNILSLMLRLEKYSYINRLSIDRKRSNELLEFKCLIADKYLQYKIIPNIRNNKIPFRYHYNLKIKKYHKQSEFVCRMFFTNVRM